ncbi:unnamed protein product [Rhizophagus irregularis]|nr:unnamed protein product [Rhizophagus irregularis]CAB5394414.1 unnamed protein product [Rhizophagus irregularis]
MYQLLTGDSNTSTISNTPLRRNNDWFPEVMYYHASLDDTQKEVKKMIKRDEWDQINAFPKSKQDLLKKINIQHNPDN